MTNKEAIERIKAALDMDDIEGHCYILTKDADRKAFYLAIKALEQEPILDKIRAEIEQLSSRYSIARESGGMGQVEWSDRLIKESEVMQVLDKYKAESEDKNEVNKRR